MVRSTLFITMFRISVFFYIVITFTIHPTLQFENKTRNQSVYSASYNALIRASQILSRRFDEAVSNELGAKLHVSTFYRSEFIDNEETVRQLSGKIEVKLKAAWKILSDMKSVIENKTTMSFTHPCPLTTLKKPSFSSNSVYEKDLIGTTIQFAKDRQPTKWNSQFKDLKVKRQYFLSHSDFGTDLNCALMRQSSLRHLYHSVFHPQRKHIIFILDNGITYFGLQKSINAIKEIVNILQPNDKLSFKLIGEPDYLLFEDDCSGAQVYAGKVSENNKHILFDYLMQLNITSNNKIAKTVLPINKNEINNILLIVMTDFSNQNQSVYHAQDLSSSQKVSASSVVIVENEILTRSMKKESEKVNFNKVNLNFMYFDNESIAAQIASRLIWLLSPADYIVDGEIIAATPYWDATQRDFLLPLVMPLKNQGLIGLDLYLTDIVEDIIYYKRLNPNERVFLMDEKMTVLFHSFFPRPEVSPEKIKFSDLKFVECNNSESLKAHIRNSNSGSLTLPYKDGNVVYTWKWVKKMFVLCFVFDEISHPKSNETENNIRSKREILYHRLDLFPPKNGKVCRHFKQLSTLEQGTVYLSPSSFSSPSSYLRDMSEGHDAALTYMQNYLAYLKGVAIQYLSNPGLKNEIRNDVNVLNPFLSYFKKQHTHGPYSSYIVRRYAVSESGVLVMYPGTVLEYEYEPIRRPWYSNAINNPGKISLTPPTLDVGGAGYIVTVSYATRQSTDQPYIVVAMDVTMGFLYKILIDSFSICSEPNTKCFIMNNRGYLISHPGLMDKTGPIEQQHITHKESLIANDMLINHKDFVAKKLCNSFPDRTIQRFYEFNMSLPGVLSNIISGDHWVHYYVSAIPGTNSFVGVVNATVNIFCPCNREDRICLNCLRMEQNECECPCECNYDRCADVSLNQTQNVPLCGPFQESNQHKSHYFNNFAENLQPCFESQCDSYSSYSTCLGIMGCEWCQIDTDGKSLLSTPFCTTQSSCFSGVLGAVTPYGEGTFGQVAAEESFSSYSAIGPVAGCVVTVCLIVVISIYCYKQNSNSASCRDLYAEGPVDNWPDQDLQLSHLQSDDHGDNSGHDRLLPATSPEAPISPYKILTGYRRPNTAGDSDHGYSTMTPHEDSEAMAFSMSEPIAMLDDTNLSDISGSVSVRGKAFTNPKVVDPSVTVLPCGKNSVIVPVTVHRNMEAS